MLRCDAARYATMALMGNKKLKGSQSFWEAEYQDASHLAMSTNHSSDLESFLRWSDRQKDETERVVDRPRVYDIGCGNGRNIHFLESVSGAHGAGFDLSQEAVRQAQKEARHPEQITVWDIHNMPYPAEENSADLVLDMMASHVLNSAERKAMRDEIDRILEPGGFVFYKTFLLDGDINARELIEKRPGDEKQSYVHPRIGHIEYVLKEQDIIEEIESQGWVIHKLSKSHKHVKQGRAAKRRTISVYIQKPYDW